MISPGNAYSPGQFGAARGDEHNGSQNEGNRRSPAHERSPPGVAQATARRLPGAVNRAHGTPDVVRYRANRSAMASAPLSSRCMQSESDLRRAEWQFFVHDRHICSRAVIEDRLVVGVHGVEHPVDAHPEHVVELDVGVLDLRGAILRPAGSDDERRQDEGHVFAARSARLPRVAQQQSVAPAAPLGGDVGAPLSSACTVVFEREVQLMEGAPDRRQAGGRPQGLADLLERGIRPHRDERGQAAEVSRGQRPPAKFRRLERRDAPVARRRCFSASTHARLT